MKNLKFILPFVLACFFSFTSCKHKIKKPPFESNPATYPVLDTSTIEIPINITAYSVKRAILNSLENPVANGNTGDIGIKLLATEQITEEELIQEIVKPYTPGYWKDVTVETYETVKESFKCALSPWKWGKCWKKVTKKVFKTIKVWIEPTEAVYRYVSKPVTKLIDKVYPVNAKINYKVHVTDIDLQFNGNKVNTTTYFKVNLSFDYEQATVPLGPKIKLKGPLTCELEAKLDLQSAISVNENKEIQIAVNEQATNVNFTKICVPGAVETIDIVQYINPKILASRIILDKVINQTVNNKIIEAINKNESKLSFKEQYNTLTAQLRKPINIGENLWLTPNISRAYLSPFLGQGSGLQNEMKVIASFSAYPIIQYTADTPKLSSINNIPFSIKTSNNPGVNLFVANQLDYKIAAQIIDTAINDALAELRSKNKLVDQWLQKKKYYGGNVQIYPSGKKLVIGVDILKQKNAKKITTLYLWAIPAYNQSKSYFYFDDISFTLETKNFLLKALKNIISINVVEDALKKEIAKNTRFDVSKEYKKITDTLKNFNISKSIFDLQGAFQPISISELFPTTKELVVYATLKGQLNATVNPLNQLANTNEEVFKPKNIGMNEPFKLPAKLMYELDQTKPFNFFPTLPEGPIKNPNLGEMFKMKSNMNINSNITMNKNRKAFNEKVINEKVNNEGNFIAAVNIGDTIYVEQNNTITYRIAELKDKTIPGDTILIRDQSGTINMYIVK